MASGGTSSKMAMPSSDQPCRAATTRSSCSLSERVIKPFSPRLTPSSRYCSASVVLPVPGRPSTRYSRSAWKPPPRMSSRPGFPVDTRCGSMDRVRDRAGGVIVVVRFLFIPYHVSGAAWSVGHHEMSIADFSAGTAARNVRLFSWADCDSPVAAVGVIQVATQQMRPVGRSEPSPPWPAVSRAMVGCLQKLPVRRAARHLIRPKCLSNRLHLADEELPPLHPGGPAPLVQLPTSISTLELIRHIDQDASNMAVKFPCCSSRAC